MAYMFTPTNKPGPGPKRVYKTKYAVGDLVTARHDLSNYVLYTSMDGIVFEYAPQDAAMYQGRTLRVKSTECGKYILEDVHTGEVSGPWVDGMLEKHQPKAEQATRVANIEDMLPEVAAFFASSGITMEQWEAEFGKVSQKIQQRIHFDRVTRIAKLARQAHSATEEGKDPSEFFKEIADVASETDTPQEEQISKPALIFGVACIFWLIAVIIAALSLSFTAPFSAPMGWLLPQYFSKLWDVVMYMIPTFLIITLAILFE